MISPPWGQLASPVRPRQRTEALRGRRCRRLRFRGGTSTSVTVGAARSEGNARGLCETLCDPCLVAKFRALRVFALGEFSFSPFFLLSAFDLSRLSACAARRANKLQSYDTRLGGLRGLKQLFMFRVTCRWEKGGRGGVKFRLPRCRPLFLLSFQRAYF